MQSCEGRTLDVGSCDRGDPMGGEVSEDTKSVHAHMTQKKILVYVEN